MGDDVLKSLAFDSQYDSSIIILRFLPRPLYFIDKCYDLLFATGSSSISLLVQHRKVTNTYL